MPTRTPEGHRAREAVRYAVRVGHLPTAARLRCTDCGRRAEEYDHWRGYEPQHKLDVQPVCRPCHQKRTARQTLPSPKDTLCPRGHDYGKPKREGWNQCAICHRTYRRRTPKP